MLCTSLHCSRERRKREGESLGRKKKPSFLYSVSLPFLSLISLFYLPSSLPHPVVHPLPFQPPSSTGIAREKNQQTQKKKIHRLLITILPEWKEVSVDPSIFEAHISLSLSLHTSFFLSLFCTLIFCSPFSEVSKNCSRLVSIVSRFKLIEDNIDLLFKKRFQNLFNKS